jgi:citrate synthase
MTTPTLHSTIWEEEAANDDPFTAEACYCRGYDVFGGLLEKAAYPEYLYLLFRGEKPAPAAARALEILAVALANPGPRDPSVHAAMAAGVGGSPAAAALMAALASGAGASGGAREIFRCMEIWQTCGCSLDTWRQALHPPKEESVGRRRSVWPDNEHPPGFAPHAVRCAQPIQQTLNALCRVLPSGCLAWLQSQRDPLEQLADHPLAMTGVAAAALTDLGFTPVDGEMLALLLRLPGAAAHALEQGRSGIRHFPFFAIDIPDDPVPPTGESCGEH